MPTPMTGAHTNAGAHACLPASLPAHQPGCDAVQLMPARLLARLLARSRRLQVHEWLAEHLPEGSRVGIDPAVHTVDAAEKLKAKLRAAGKQLVALGSNPVDEAWEGRPAPPEVGGKVGRWSGRWGGDCFVVGSGWGGLLPWPACCLHAAVPGTGGGGRYPWPVELGEQEEGWCPRCCSLGIPCCRVLLPLNLPRPPHSPCPCPCRAGAAAGAPS